MHAVVVGGGIVGLSSAYYLREHGIATTVLEQSALGTGSTGRANGGIRAQFSSPVSVAFSLASIDVWESFEAEFDVDIAYRRPGYLFLARSESTAERFRENVRKQNDLGVQSEYVSPETARDRCPALHAEAFAGATYCATDGFADPYLALQGFASAAREAGATIRTGVAVTNIEVDATGAVSGVQTTDGSFDADFVVNAAGPWAPAVGEMADLQLPVSPRRRALAIVDPERSVPERVPFTIDADVGVHFRPEREGTVVVGGRFAESDPPMDPDRYPERVSLEWSAQIVERLGECAGYFGPDSEIVRTWAGLYAVTPDHHPIVEESIPGFVNAVGFSGHGFMHAPATGTCVAEIVAHGEAKTIDVSTLSSDRFDRGRTLEEGTVID